MRKTLEPFYLHLLKPTLMIVAFITNLMYLKDSYFVNEFYHWIYFATFCVKPFFFLLLFLGLIHNYRINTFSGFMATFLIIIGIFFGFPVKEYADFFNTDILKDFFEGREYILTDYLTSHYIVNIFTENIPVLCFAIINNIMLPKWKAYHLDPLITNTTNIFMSGIIVLLLSGNKTSI